jgi:excisionase family DNA binding protein
LQHNSPLNSGTSVTAATPLWNIKQAAEYLRVSESWVRRHLSELPHLRHGRLIRFDPDELRSKVSDGKSLESGRNTAMPVPRRYQQGSIVWKDTASGKVAYGTYRADVRTALND